MDYSELNDSLSKTVKQIMMKEPFYGFFLIMVDKYWDNEVETISIGKEGINFQLIINPEYWNGLDKTARIGAILHELNHIALRHVSTRKSVTDKQCYDIASDLEVNQYLDKIYLNDESITLDKFPELKLPEKAGSLSYYELVKQAKDKKDKTGSSGCPNLDKMLDGEGEPNHDWSDFDNVSETESDLIEKQLNYVLNQAKDITEKNKGNVPGHFSDLIYLEQLTKAKFDWKSYIRKFVGYSMKVTLKKTRMKENFKFEDAPALKLKPLQHILLGIDTSGLNLEF